MPEPNAPDPEGPVRTEAPAESATQPTAVGPGVPGVNARALSSGTSIGRYVVLQQLGEGGMGVVYAAYDPELNRKVAIKLIRDQARSADRVARQRLLREAQAMARLSHPNVIPVFDVGTAFEQVFVAMEFIDGTTLREWLRAKPRTQAEIVATFVQAGRGLAAAHEAGLVHRDFKPDNVLVSKAGRVLVTDFGLVRSVHEDDSEEAPARSAAEPRAPGLPDGTTPPELGAAAGSATLDNSRLTQAGVAVGTVSYMAPEQLISNESGPRSDQFSFCVALYEACYRAAPFPGKDGRERVEQMLRRGPPAPPAQYRLPPRWHRAIVRGLEVKPEARFPSMKPLLKVLARDAGRRRRRRLLIGGALAVAAVLAVLYVRAQRRSLDAFCAHAADRLPPMWNDAHKKEVHRALLGADRHTGAAIWKHLAPELDEYARQWKKMNKESCQATLIRREQPALVYELRNACLDRRYAEFAAFTALLLTADKHAARRAANAVSDFTPVSACADVPALSAPTPLPDAPQARERIRGLYRSIAELNAFEHTGKYSVVAERAHAVVEMAQAVGYPPALAEAQILLARILSNSGAVDRAEQAYIAAAAAAVEGHDVNLAAKAYTALVGLAGARRRFADADVWEVLAKAQLQSGHASPSTRIWLLVHSCQNATARRRLAQAETACQAAATLSAGMDREPSVLRAVVLRSQANLKFQQDHLAEALTLFSQSLKLQEKLYGPLHPMVAATLRDETLVHLAQGELGPAHKSALRSLDIDEHSFGSLHAGLADALNLLAQLALASGDAAGAIALSEKALTGTQASLPDEHIKTAVTYSALGDVLYRAGRFADALTRHRAALTRLLPTRAEVRAAAAALGVAEDLVALGQPEQALPILEWGFAPRLLTEEVALATRRQFAWARALWAAGAREPRGRAVELALAARAGYAQLGSQARRELAEVDAWLAANKIDGKAAAKAEK